MSRRRTANSNRTGSSSRRRGNPDGLTFDNDGPILLIIMAEDCGACMNFKQNNFQELLKKLSQDNMVTPHVIQFKSRGKVTLDTSKYHPDIQNIIFWFPMFVVIAKKCWQDHSLPLDYHILGSYLDDSGNLSCKMTNNPDDIRKYLMNYLKKNDTKPYANSSQDNRYRNTKWPTNDQRGASTEATNSTRIQYQPYSQDVTSSKTYSIHNAIK